MKQKVARRASLVKFALVSFIAVVIVVVVLKVLDCEIQNVKEQIFASHTHTHSIRAVSAAGKLQIFTFCSHG